MKELLLQHGTNIFIEDNDGNTYISQKNVIIKPKKVMIDWSYNYRWVCNNTKHI